MRIKTEMDSLGDELVASALSQGVKAGVVNNRSPRPSGVFTRRLSNALADATARRTEDGQIDPVSREQIRLAVTRGVARGRREVKLQRRTATGR